MEVSFSPDTQELCQGPAAGNSLKNACIAPTALPVSSESTVLLHIQ